MFKIIEGKPIVVEKELNDLCIHNIVDIQQMVINNDNKIVVIVKLTPK